MKLDLAAPRPAPPLTVEAIRQGIEDSAAISRLARRFKLRLIPGGLVGKRGPGFEKRRAT